MTNEEALQTVIDKCKKADRMEDRKKASLLYREAESVFNARWPNPVYYEHGSWHTGNA